MSRDDDDFFFGRDHEIEADVEDDVVAFAENRGWLVRKMQYVGRRGCRDHDFYKDGKLVMMEFKKPGKRKADIHQQREKDRYAEVGWTIHVVNDRDQAARLLGYERYERD